MCCTWKTECNASLPSLEVQNMVSEVDQESVHEWLMSSMVWMSLHTRKMVNSRLWNTMWEISLCLCPILPSLKRVRRCCPSGLQAGWAVVLTQYSWSGFLSEFVTRNLLSWIWPFHLCTLRKTWIPVCNSSMFLFGWSEDHLCYSKNLAGSADWVYRRTQWIIAWY